VNTVHFDEGTPLAHVARHQAARVWQLVPTRWHYQPRKGEHAQTPITGFTGKDVPFLGLDEVLPRVEGLKLHLRGGPGCTGVWSKPATRPPLGISLLDVDHDYNGKTGGDTLAKLQDELGPLPPAFSVTARGPETPSRRLAVAHPEDLVFTDKAFAAHGGFIEVVRTGHRYTWVPPAIHTKDGVEVGPVLWYSPDREVVDTPSVDQIRELSTLSTEWVDYLRKTVERHTSSSAASASPDQPVRLTRGHAQCKLQKSLERFAQARGGDFRNALFGLAANLTRFAMADGRTVDDVREMVARFFDEYAPYPAMNADDEQWVEEGIEQGLATPWRFDETADSWGFDVSRFPTREQWEAQQQSAADAADPQASGAATSGELVSLAPPPLTVSDPEKRPLYPSPGQPMKVARKIMEGYWSPEIGYTLRRWRDQWIRYDGVGWVQLPDERITDWVSHTLEHADYEKQAKGGDVERVPWAPSPQKVGNVIKQMETITRLDAEIEEGTWIGQGKVPDFRPIVVANGLLNPETGILHPHTPRWFSLTRIPIPYDPDAAEPEKWLTTLRQQWPLVDGLPSDEEKLAQEWAGYVLSGRTDLQKGLAMPGPPRSSKGTFVWVLTQLIGERNYIGLNARDFDTQFGLQELPGKTLASIPDLRGSKGNHNVTSLLLEIIGEDTIQIDRKNRTPWVGQVRARMMLLSNLEPALTDASGVIVTRWVILPTTTSFLGREDEKLKDKLAAELPGILLWAVKGLRRLNEQRRFTEPASGRAVAQSMRRSSSPVAAFAEDHIVWVPLADDEEGEDRSEVWQAWQAWAKHTGRERGSMETLLNALSSTSQAGGVRERRPNGRRRRWYGLRLAAEGYVAAEKFRRGVSLDGELGGYGDDGKWRPVPDFLWIAQNRPGAKWKGDVEEGEEGVA